jgi:hypothetical protein
MSIRPSALLLVPVPLLLDDRPTHRWRRPAVTKPVYERRPGTAGTRLRKATAADAASQSEFELLFARELAGVRDDGGYRQSQSFDTPDQVAS